jgi:hypothetical protein
MDIASLTAAPRAFRLDGAEYTVSPLTYADIGEIQAFFKDEVPDPRAEARRHMDGLPDAVAIHIWDRAVEAACDWPPRLGDPRATALLLSPRGMALVLRLALRRGHPGLDAAEYERLAGRMSRSDFDRLLGLAFDLEPADPKAAAATATPAGA